jgi:hypothetical protein
MDLLTLSSAYRGTALLLAGVVEADDFYTGEDSPGVLDRSLSATTPCPPAAVMRLSLPWRTPPPAWHAVLPCPGCDLGLGSDHV